MKYRWLSEAEAKRRFPHDPKLWNDVTDQAAMVCDVVPWTPDTWAAAMLVAIDDPHVQCTAEMAVRFRAAEAVMRMEEGA